LASSPRRHSECSRKSERFLREHSECSKRPEWALRRQSECSKRMRASSGGTPSAPGMAPMREFGTRSADWCGEVPGRALGELSRAGRNAQRGARSARRRRVHLSESTREMVRGLRDLRDRLVVSELSGWRIPEGHPSPPPFVFANPIGALPDWCCEVLSDSTRNVDRESKFRFMPSRGSSGYGSWTPTSVAWRCCTS